jgi:copper resistance protein C
MFVRRTLAVLLLIATAVLAFVTPASAHTSLKSSNPAKGASLATAPPEIVLTFSEPVQVETGAVTVAGPGGAQWTVGQVAVAGPVVTAPVTPAGPAGQYTISYRVISADGDAVRGTVAFSLTAAVPTPTTATTTTATTTGTTTSTTPPPVTTQQTTPTAQQTDESGGVPVWVWIAGAVVVVALGVFLAVRAGRSRTSQDSRK